MSGPEIRRTRRGVKTFGRYFEASEAAEWDEN